MLGAPFAAAYGGRYLGQLAQNIESVQPQKPYTAAGAKLADLASAPKIEGGLPEGYLSLSGLSANAASGKLPKGFSRAVNRETGDIDIIDINTKKIYKLAGEDSAGNPIYKSGRWYYTFENGKQTIPVKDVSLFDDPANSYAGRTQQLGASGGEITTTEAYTLQRGSSPDIAAKPENWLPERRPLQDKLVADATDAAVKLAAAQTGEPTINAMRGNTGAGKTRATKGKEELQNMPVVNADLFKQQLIQNSPIPVVNKQVHVEGAALASRFKANLLDPQTGVKSFMVDGRLGGAADVASLAQEAKASGRKLNVYDVDAPLENSLMGVLMREHGGPDPVVAIFDVIGKGGFEPARANRQAVMELFENDPSLGRYELYGTKPNGDKFLVATVENGKLQVTKDGQGYYDLLTDGKDAAQQTEKVRNTIIDDAEIQRATKDLPESGWKRDAIAALSRYKGLTWAEAIAKHGEP